jgi:hypothetical protein
MASNAAPLTQQVSADRFFFRLALSMAILIIAGFSVQFLLGRSSLSARPLVHIHGIVFMGWTMLFTVQSWLGSRGSMALHRRLGWIAVAWVVLMVVMALAITIDVTRRGIAPFFFQPQLFLIANPMTMLGFVVLFALAIRNRRKTDWHQRLHMCAMAMLLGPAFGRLLPMPLMIPWAFEAAIVAGLYVPLVGMWRDRRETGHVHPAWWTGLLVFALVIILFEGLAHSSVGGALYGAATAGTPGALVDPMGYPPPPPMM